MTGSILPAAGLHIGRRSRQLSDILATDGYEEVIRRVRSKVSDWVKPNSLIWPVLREDVIAADLSRPFLAPIPKISKGAPIQVNWVTGPAAPGSGGHTTTYRIIEHLQGRGYLNRIYFYDPFGGDHKYYANLARKHYGISCEIDNARTGMADAHAVVATDWPSAYAVFNARSAGKRFYFIQDYEPYFYPVGANSQLAENTYRMGFHAITAGRWLAEKLSREFGITADYFRFGCDTARYRRDPASERTGVAFYARSGTPRRAVELGLLALELFAQRQPNVELHLFGQRLSKLPYSFINHGLVTPARLNEIYNRCRAGLSLSLTNVSLVPYEMLACGCIPIVNEADHNRMVLDNAHVRYAPATPHALAAALDDVVRSRSFDALSRQAAESVSAISWDDAAISIDAAFRRALLEGAREPAI